MTKWNRTKIVATVGPASVSIDVPLASYAAGSGVPAEVTVQNVSTRVVDVSGRLEIRDGLDTVATVTRLADQWVADEPEPPLPVRLPASVLHALPKAPVTAQFREPGPLSLQHQLALGGQEDGTLSGTLELASRRNLDEDRDAGADAEDFIELRGTHRKYLQHWDGYHRFDLLGRIRNDGGPTLGVWEFLNILTD